MQLPFFIAKRFVAAQDVEGTLPIAADLKRQGLATTLDLLGEYVRERSVVDQAKASYLDLVRALHETNAPIDRNISIKLSMLGLNIDPSLCLDNMRELLDTARSTDTFVRIDMEGSDATEATLAIFEKVHAEYDQHVGVVLQAYLKRTREDVERMCTLGARVRLCKGAYKEPAAVAFQHMPEIRERYLEYMELLLTRGHFPAIATHDDQLLDATKSVAGSRGITPDSFEFQMLYGIRPETQLQIRQEGHGMRVYVPFGTAWLPYFSRRLRERKENVWFILKNLFRR
ncbi:MAG: proline dehydrogenase [Bacteroidetes bacterium CG12_big_fil_rev_8_21_14_0_65_60_17]|nr:MAG: proline dehydrogenase [Bacteroidetes bacterium CG12_big_fil_rev_8_21_14_0_65_60_17]